MFNDCNEFFNTLVIKYNDSDIDDIEKLTPQNARQRHLVQAILAIAQGIALEVYSKDENKWIDASNANSISIECEYRIKLTSLPIPRKLRVFLDINIEKLTPQNARQRHLVQAILAMAQGKKLEVYSKDENKWIDASNASSISIKCKYRIKVTPLPISRKLWRFLDKDIRFCAMNRYGLVCFYKQRPELYEDGWRVTNKPNDRFPASPLLYINTGGINWKCSLTKRPEGV